MSLAQLSEQPRSDMSGQVPERLGKYQVMGEIGRGSMGTVYLGHDPYADRNVAIKVAHAEQLNDEEGGERYRDVLQRGSYRRPPHPSQYHRHLRRGC